MTRAVKDCTYVIHVASPLPVGNPRDDMELIGPAVEGTKSVLEACAKTKGGVKRVVLTSSCAAISGKRTGAIDPEGVLLICRLCRGGVGISLVEVFSMKGWGNLSFRCVKRLERADRCN